MSFENVDFLFKILRENDKLNIDVPENFRCKKCLKLLKNSCQVPCGCRYCQNCVNLMIFKGVQVCPGTGEDCKDGNLLNASKDFIFDKEIYKLIVKCPMETCFYKCEVSALYEHLKVCKKKDFYYSFGKSEYNDIELTNSNILEYLQIQLQNHTNRLTDRMDKTKRELTKNIEIKENEIETLTKQLIISSAKTDEISKELILIKKERSMNKRFVNFKQEVNKKLDKWIEKTDKDDNTMKHENPYLEDIRKQMNSYEMKLTSSVSETEKCMKLINGDIFIWTIGKYDTTVGPICIFSQQFQGTKKPYKLKLASYPNGYGTMKHTHLTIFLYVYYSDAYATWPFSANVTIKISNSNNPQVFESMTKCCIIPKPSLIKYEYSEPFDFPLTDLTSAGISLNDDLVVEYSNEFI